MHLFSRIFPPHIHRRLCLTQWLKISGLLWDLVHDLKWQEVCCYVTGGRAAPKESFSQTKQASLMLGSLTVAGSFLSQQDCLAFTIQQMLVVKDLRWEFLTKLQLAQSFPAGEECQLQLLFIIHEGRSQSPIKQPSWRLEACSQGCTFCSPVHGWREKQANETLEQRSSPMSHSSWFS